MGGLKGFGPRDGYYYLGHLLYHGSRFEGDALGSFVEDVRGARLDVVWDTQEVPFGIFRRIRRKEGDEGDAEEEEGCLDHEATINSSRPSSHLM